MNAMTMTAGRRLFQGLLLAVLALTLAACTRIGPGVTQTFNSPVPTARPPASQSPLLPSPAGHILYQARPDETSLYHLAVMDADGANVRRLAESSGSDVEASWSPDGGRIAFTSDRDGQFEIYVMDRDGGNVKRLTRDPGMDWGPAWSPDSSRIAFASNRSGTMQLFVMRADGSDQLPLAPGSAGDGWAPAWSPTRNELAFVSDRKGTSEIYLLQLDSGVVTQLTDNDRQDERPAWSPDGNQLVYMGAKDNTVLFDPDEIYVVSRTGGQPRQLTDNLVGDISPSWSPDGGWIAFSSSRDGGWNLYIVPAAGGGEALALTRGNAWNRAPKWGP